MGRRVNTTLEAKLAKTGGMHYVRIPTDTVDFYGFKPGDRLKITILEVREEEERPYGEEEERR